MTKKTNLVPKKRLKEFEHSDAWEQRKLGEVIDNQYNGQTPSRENDNFWNGTINWLSSGELNRGVVSETIEKITEEGMKNANLKIVPKGTFVMAITGLEAAGTRGNCAKLGIDTTLNQSCTALFPNKKIFDTSFLFHWYRRVGEEYGLKYTQGTKQQSYNAELIKILPIILPSLDEQIKIALFFDKLEKFIALHHSELEKLKALKSSYLSEMFPSEDEKRPKRRFAGFNDDWGQHKLIEIADVFDNLRIPITASKREKGNIPYYGANGIQDYVSGFTHEGEFVLIAEDGANDLINYPVKYVNGQIWVNNHAHVVSGKTEQLDNLFLSSRMKAMNISRWLVGGGRAKLNGEVLKKIPILVPSFQEQVKIGEFFNHLDSTITLHQNKLEKLINLKEAYLNEMFV